MLELKGCPRCRGDVYYDSDYYGVYKQCIQCGYLEDVDTSREQAAVAVVVAAKPGRKAA